MQPLDAHTEARSDERTIHGPNGETEPLDLLDVNLHCPDEHEPNPWPLYDWLREEAPLYQDRNGLWHVSRYDDIVHVARDPETFTSRMGNRPLLPNDESFIHLDGDIHKKRRGLVRSWFAPPAMRRLEAHVRDAVNELIDGFVERGHCDLVEDFAAPLPARIICEMTGIPAEQAEVVRHTLDVFGRGGNGPDWVTEEVNEAFLQFGSLHCELVDERRANPKDDLLSIWLHTPIDGELMTEDQVLWEHTMLMFGGSETTRNAVSGGALELARRPAERERLLADPSLIGNGAEEAIRWVSPFVSMARTVTRDAVLHGKVVREGEQVVMLYPPASRDPRKFAEPHRFDVGRSFANRTIAFGTGGHVCLGEHLARLEVRVAYEELLRRIPDWQQDGPGTWTRSCFVRGLTSLPVAFTPGRRERS
jgi:cytochrome P450 family 142 subfamily A polypeptide 1